jgi:DNA-binding transcriptional MocR family regulator
MNEMAAHFVDRLYIVPVGSNPTGSTMLAQRKKEIYDVCVKHGKYLPLLSHVLKMLSGW